MGLFNRFKKENKKTPAEELTQTDFSNISMQIEQYENEDGKPCYLLDYYDPNSYMKQLYDITRLIIEQTPETLPSGNQVYCAQVSWYGISDCEYLDGNEKYGRKYDMKNIRLQVDLEKLMYDVKYQSAVMKELLSSKRVERYLKQGLEENPQYQCGNYVGYIDRKQSGEYGKFFDATVGREVHNLPEQKVLRRRYREQLEKDKVARNNKRRAEIERLNREME